MINSNNITKLLCHDLNQNITQKKPRKKLEKNTILNLMKSRVSQNECDFKDIMTSLMNSLF